MGTALPSTIARYKILKRLGEGGMGSLYLARDPAIDRLIAIKLLREDVESDELRERFTREAKAVGKLRHQNIVMVFDVGQDAGRPFIAMEYIEGYTLGLVVREKRQMPLDQKLKWLEELCAGLGYAHKQGIIHRDVKPANIMVDQDGTLKILDFGIARLSSAAKSGMTQTGTLMGTLSYMSPEQMTGQPVDHRSDIFAVGAVCYEMLAYQRAFPGDIQDGVLHRIIHEPPKPLGQFVPDIDPRLVTIVSKALEKNRDVRYQDLEAMKKDIVRLRMQLEEGIPPPPPVEAPAVDKTIIVHTPVPSAPPPPPAAPPQRLDPKQRRAQEIDKLMDTASRAIDSGEIDRALESVDQVLFLDPDHADALTLQHRAQAVLDEQRVKTLIRQARAKLAARDTDEASRLAAQAGEINADSPDVQQLQAEIDDAAQRVAAEQERELELRQTVERAESKLGQRAFEAAIEYADQALALDPQHARALQVKQRATDAIATRQRAADEAAKKAAAEAAARKAAEEAAAKKAAEEVARQAAAEVAAKKAAEEAAAKKAAGDAAARKAAEEAAARKAAAEVAARKAAEEAATRKAAEEAARKAAAEEAARKAAARQRELAAQQAAQAGSVAEEGTIVVPPPVEYQPAQGEPALAAQQAAEPVAYAPPRKAYGGDTQVAVPIPADIYTPPVEEARVESIPVPVPAPRPVPAAEPPKSKTMLFAGLGLAAVLVLGVGGYFMTRTTTPPITNGSGGSETPGGAAAVPATLSVNITPFAHVEVKDDKGAKVGECESPCLLSLPSGTYNVSATNNKFQPLSDRVTVGAGGAVLNKPLPGFDPENAVKELLGNPK